MLQVCVCERERGREREICMIELVLLLYVESGISFGVCVHHWQMSVSSMVSINK